MDNPANVVEILSMFGSWDVFCRKADGRVDRETQRKFGRDDVAAAHYAVELATERGFKINVGGPFPNKEGIAIIRPHIA